MTEAPPPTAKRYVLRRAAPTKSYRIDYHRELNPEQQAVVFAPDGPTVVGAVGLESGAPGTGCTFSFTLPRA